MRDNKMHAGNDAMDLKAVVRRSHRVVYVFVAACIVLTGILLVFGNNIAPLPILLTLGILIIAAFRAAFLNHKAKKALRTA